MEKKITILYVDDEEHNLKSFKASFRREFEIHTAISGKDGLEILKTEDISVILTDQRMPEMTGIDFLVAANQVNPEPIRILVTGYSDVNAVIDSINKGHIYRYISKPWNEEELKQTILSAFEIYNLRRENKDLIGKLERANDQLEFLLRQRLLS